MDYWSRVLHQSLPQQVRVQSVLYCRKLLAGPPLCTARPLSSTTRRCPGCAHLVVDGRRQEVFLLVAVHVPLVAGYIMGHVVRLILLQAHRCPGCAHLVVGGRRRKVFPLAAARVQTVAGYSMGHAARSSLQQVHRTRMLPCPSYWTWASNMDPPSQPYSGTISELHRPLSSSAKECERCRRNNVGWRRDALAPCVVFFVQFKDRIRVPLFLHGIHSLPPTVQL